MILLYLKLKFTEKDELFPNYENDVNQYVEDVLNLPKIFPDNHTPNETKKNLIKHLIVSICGSLAQNPRKTQFKCCNDPMEFREYHERKELLNFFEIDENTLGLVCKNQNLYDVDLKNNGILYAEILAKGRQKLDNLIKSVQKMDYAKVAMVDTDSAVCFVKRGMKEYFLKKLGEYGPTPGKLSHEVKGEIIEFCGVYPKNYSLLIKEQNGTLKQQIKMAGFQICNEISHRNFGSMLEDLRKNDAKVTQIPQVRGNKRKIFSFSNYHFWKRRIILDTPDLTTVPYGMKIST